MWDQQYDMCPLLSFGRQFLFGTGCELLLMDLILPMKILKMDMDRLPLVLGKDLQYK